MSDDTTPGQARATYCARCGEHAYHPLSCVHLPFYLAVMSRDEAMRVRARYALGKLHNPEHDITSYRD